MYSSTSSSSSSAELVFSSEDICDLILGHLGVDSSSVLDHLDLRRVSKGFGKAVLSKVRKAHTKLVVTPGDPTPVNEFGELPEEELEIVDHLDVVDQLDFVDELEDNMEIEEVDFDRSDIIVEEVEMEEIEFDDEIEVEEEIEFDDDEMLEEPIMLIPADWFRVNGKKVSLTSDEVKPLRFLFEVARIKPHSLTFEGFEPNADVHDIMLNLINSYPDIKITTLVGADEICPDGCYDCNAIVQKCHVYGPMQTTTKFLSPQRLQKLTIAEEYLLYLVKILNSAFEHNAMEQAVRAFIPPFVRCDHLELLLSDLLFGSEQAPRIPLNIIELMVSTWNVSQVTVKFLNGNSGPEHNEWKNIHGVFSELQLTDETEKVVVDYAKQRAFGGLDYLTIDLLNAHAFAEAMTSRDFVPELRNLIPTLRKVFPSRTTCIDLPLGLMSFAAHKLDEFIGAVGDFAWSKATVRNQDIHMRGYLGSSQQILEVETETRFVANWMTTIGTTKCRSLKREFDNWPCFLDGCKEKSESTIITLDEAANRRRIYLQLIRLC